MTTNIIRCICFARYTAVWNVSAQSQPARASSFDPHWSAGRLAIGSRSQWDDAGAVLFGEHLYQLGRKEPGDHALLPEEHRHADAIAMYDTANETEKAAARLPQPWRR